MSYYMASWSEKRTIDMRPETFVVHVLVVSAHMALAIALSAFSAPLFGNIFLPWSSSHYIPKPYLTVRIAGAKRVSLHQSNCLYSISRSDKPTKFPAMCTGDFYGPHVCELSAIFYIVCMYMLIHTSVHHLIQSWR